MLYTRFIRPILVAVRALPAAGGQANHPKIQAALLTCLQQAGMKIKVLRHTDGVLFVHHGPRMLARYSAQGQELTEDLSVAA